MNVLDTVSGEKHAIEILPVEETDFKSITKSRYFFNWKTEKEFEVYKLRISGANEILGLISLERIPDEWRVHIRLLTVSKENKGREKLYENIAGNLIAYAGKIAINDYAEYACVSLRPKLQIAAHYINTYNMRTTGMTLSLEAPEIIALINLYDNE